MRPYRAFAAAALLALMVRTTPARADTSIAASGGLQALSARVDFAQSKLHYGKCAASPCALTDEVAIKLLGPADEKNAKTTSVEMVGGKRALWVHVPSTGASSWDAVLVGAATPLVYSEQTGPVRGQPGSMSGGRVQVVPDGLGHSFLARGTTSEDFTICGREVLAYAEVLDPQSLEWKRASFQQLRKDEVERALSTVVTIRQNPPDRPLAPLLAARLASSGAHPSAIADLDPSTTWSEAAAGMGRGEFVVLNAPSEVPILRLTVTVAPPTPSPTGASPRTFFLATSDQVASVTMPEDAWLHPGRAYDITFPQPLKTSCLALVLDDAFVHGPNPDVSISELTAYSELDIPGATLDGVAADLGASGRRADAAAAILKRVGDAALPSIVTVWPKLDVYGRKLAIDVAAGATCGSASTQILLGGLCDADVHVAQKAESALQRPECGRSSEIVAAVHSTALPACSKVPQYLALLGKQAALPKLAEWMVSTDGDARANVRHQFAYAAREAPAQVLAAMIADPHTSPYVRLEMLRAMGPRLREIQPSATAALDALLVTAADVTTRYLALEPLAELAKSGDRSAQAHISAMLAHDPNWPIRARAAELARDLPSVQSELVAAVDDAQPRVRQAAIDTISILRTSPAAVRVEKHLESDPWTFVRVAAARALGAMPAARDLDKSLATALGTDASPHVRSAILVALAAHQARAYSDVVRARLDDAQELPLVRIAAARALGGLCDPNQLERLTEIGRSASDPMVGGDELALGLAAIAALGDIHPADLATRLAKLRDKSVRDAVRGAAEHALASPARCH